MTQNQLIQEYEFDPTLTTRELSAIQEKAILDKFIFVMNKYDLYFETIDEVRAIAERFNYDAEAYADSCAKEQERYFKYLDGSFGYVDDSDDFKAIKAECKALVDRMPFDSESAKNVKDTVDACDNANELFWNFFFNFLQDDIQKEMEQRLPDVKEEIHALCQRNAKRYAK